MATEKPFSLDPDKLYGDLFTPLFRYVFFRTGDYDVACDVTQASFLKFLQQNKVIESHDHAQKLLFVIARNTLIDFWRTGAVRQTIRQEEWGDIPSTDATPEESCISAEDTAFVKTMLSGLGAIEAEVVSLRLSGGTSYEVIAQTLALTPDNARQLYSRALRKIHSAIEKTNYFT